MNILRKPIFNYPIEVWIAILALILTFFAWIMQAYSLYNWESAVKLGLQNGNFQGDALIQALATKKKAKQLLIYFGYYHLILINMLLFFSLSSENYFFPSILFNINCLNSIT